jgi:TatD DNase family protein
LQFPGKVLATAGLHPHDASLWSEQRDGIAELARSAVAVGECGLDFYRDLSPREHQVAAFRDQLALAADLDKPVIVHCRDAFAEVFDAIEASSGGHRTVLHCWTGGPRWTKRFAELGATFSFAGPVAFETGDTVRRGAAAAPRERTMVETDTPYLSPPPHRGEENQPARVVLVGAALAAAWDEDVAETARLTTAAAEQIFRG